MQCGFGPLSASALLSPGPSCSWRVERSVAPAWFSLHRSPGLVGTSSLTLTLSPTPTLLPHQAASTWDHRATEHGGIMYPGHPPLGRVQFWEPEATPVSPQVTHWLPWGPAAAIWVLGERKLSREDRHSHRYIRVPGALGHIHKCYSKTQYKCTGGKKTGRKYSEMLTVVTSCGF